MAGASRTRDFFENGSSNQFQWILNHYDEALKLKAESKSSKPENVIKLDKWYQTELPKKIKSRGKEAHLIHDELVQTIKWKVARGKFQANMVNLIQMNTPRVVMVETKKAFRKLSKTGDIQASAQALCNLKGVGPTMASAVLAAGAPHLAPFMADECLLAMPDGESLDYTMKEYMRFVEYVQKCVDRLKAQGGDWDPHKVELAVWTHSVLNEYKAELILDMPSRHTAAAMPASPAAMADDNAESNGTDQDTNGSASASDEERCGDVSSVANGEDSALSPPPSAMADFENTNSMESEVTTNNGDHSGAENEDSNLGNNGTTDSNHSVQNEDSQHEISEAVTSDIKATEVSDNRVDDSNRETDLNTDKAMPDPTEVEVEAEKVAEETSKVAEVEKETAEVATEQTPEASTDKVADAPTEVATDKPSEEKVTEQIQPDVAPPEKTNGVSENGAIQENGATSNEAMEIENGAAEKEAKHENGAKEVLPCKVPEVSPPSMPHPSEVGDPHDDLPVAKRTAEDDLEETPPVKKLKPENTEPATATV